MSSNLKSHCATSEREEERREPESDGVEGTEEEWKLGKEKERKGGGGGVWRERNVSAKVFINILRQMISVSFS